MTAEIFDRGYRQYDGPRSGVPGAMKTLVKHSLKRSLGLGRSARFKVIPVLVILFSFIPALVFLGIAALFPEEINNQFIPTYAEYFTYTIPITSLVLFSAFIAPDLLCTDRRSSMLGVYLASPLDRRSYLVSKAIAISIMLGIITVGPPLFLMIALVLEGSGPDTVGEFLTTGLRIIGSGIMMSAFYTAISFAVAAATDRAGTAIAAILGLLFGSGAIITIITETTQVDSNIRLLNFLNMPGQLGFRIHGEAGSLDWLQVSTSSMWLAFFGILLGSTLWIWSRYGPLLVRR